MISSIYNEALPISINDKQSLLDKHNIALYDVIYECDIIGSSDSSIKNVIPINIKEILDNFPNIQTIVLNGGLASKLFDKYLFKDVPSNIKIYRCPSTSPANAKMNTNYLINSYKLALI